MSTNIVDKSIFFRRHIINKTKNGFRGGILGRGRSIQVEQNKFLRTVLIHKNGIKELLYGSQDDHTIRALLIVKLQNSSLTIIAGSLKLYLALSYIVDRNGQSKLAYIFIDTNFTGTFKIQTLKYNKHNVKFLIYTISAKKTYGQEIF